MTKTRYIRRKKMCMIDYGAPEYLDGAQMRYTVRADDFSWCAYFSHEDDAKTFLAMKSGTVVE